MPDANVQTKQEETIIHQHLQVLVQELSKGREGAATRMLYHPQLGLVTAAEAKFARQYGWDTYRRY